MNAAAPFSIRRCVRMARAEFLKIWASRVPLVILVTLVTPALVAAPAALYFRKRDIVE